MKWTAALAMILICCAGAPAAEKRPLTLDAGTLKATFDLANRGNIVSLRGESIEVVSNPQNALLFKIGLVQGNRARYFSNHDFEQFEAERTAGGARLVFQRLAARDITVTVEIQRADVALDFRIKVVCGPQTVCSDVLFPCIGGFESLSGNPQDDRYVLPHLTGQLLLNPAQQLRQGRKQKLGSEGYPGTQGLQFHALYNQHAGVVMFTPDSGCTPKEFNLGRDTETNALTWYVKHYCDETPGFAFEPEYPVRVQACGPSWYDAADIYAAWGRKQWWMEKQIPRRSWLDAMPVIANAHDNEHYSRMLPSWYAKHQPQVNAMMGNRPLINDLGQWEHYGFWIAPDSFPPLGGEQAMIRAAREVRSHGNHIKHLFSCGEYWMHKDTTADTFEENIRPMAVLPRGPATRQQLEKQFPRLGKYVYMCPTAEGYHAKLEHLVRKLADYHHDFISMDIWPLGQPKSCHNSAHDHPPGLGKWYVDANIELIKRLQAAVFERQPQAIFGGESMAEPYLPWMQATLMRSTQAPVERARGGRISMIRIPLFDYIYGDQVIEWSAQTMSQLPQCKQVVALQFVRGNLINISDKYEARVVDFQAMQLNANRQPGDPIPPIKLRVKLGTPELRRENYAFAARANDTQRGRFNPYFSRGRSGRFPDVLVEDSDNWRTLEIYSGTPAVGVLRHPTESSLLWVLGNGASEKKRLRLAPVGGKSVHSSTLGNKISRSVDDVKAPVEIFLEPHELAVVEWK
jgi:hypothetical protein